MGYFTKIQQHIDAGKPAQAQQEGQMASPTDTAKVEFKANGYSAELHIDGVIIHIDRESCNKGRIGYAEGPDNMGTTLYNNNCIKFLIEDALNIKPRSSKAIYETVNHWLRDWSEEGRKSREVTFN